MSTVAYVGSIGFRITITCTDADTGSALDLTGATSTDVVMLSPAGVRRTLAATALGDPTDGVLEYETVAGDLYMPGTYLIQPQLVLATGEEPRCEPISFTVGRSL